MYTYSITFRIVNKTINGQSYQDRYNNLIENIEAARDGGFWSDPTSFYLLESQKNTPNLARGLARGLNANHDMLLVFDTLDMSAAYFGDVEEEEVLKSFFKTPIRVG